MFYHEITCSDRCDLVLKEHQRKVVVLKVQETYTLHEIFINNRVVYLLFELLQRKFYVYPPIKRYSEEPRRDLRNLHPNTDR